MPLHDVKCSECGHIEEILYQHPYRPYNYACDECKKVQRFRPLISSPRIVIGGTRQIEMELEKSAADGLF